MKTAELTGSALDWAVAKCEEHDISINKTLRYTELRSLVLTDVCDDDWTLWQPSIDWAQGGPIIEREGITVCNVSNRKWVAGYGIATSSRHNQAGPAPLLAAMRCHVASKLGDDVAIPDGLTK